MDRRGGEGEEEEEEEGVEEEEEEELVEVVGDEVDVYVVEVVEKILLRNTDLDQGSVPSQCVADLT